MAYEGKCGSCENFEEQKGRNIPYDSNNRYYVKGFCTWYGKYYYPDESCDDHYRKRGSVSGGCYITTMVHSVLGMDDKCDTMETLRSLRDNVLQKDEKYKKVLFEYDTIGPKIADKLQNEDKFIVKVIYNDYLVPIVNLIKENKNEEAISKYKFMTNNLATLYHIDKEVEVTDNYDYTQGGHGKIK